MNSFAKSLLFVILLTALFAAQGQAQTISAASCNGSDVQAALNSVVADGSTVNIPAGTCTWTSQVSYTGSHAFVLLGAGSLTIVGGGDATVIKDSLSGSGSPALSITVPPGKTFRIAGITFEAGGRSVVDNGSLQIFCNDTVGELRLDHIHLSGLSTASGIIDCFGVMDHSLTDESSDTSNWMHIWHPNYNKGASSGNGDGSWASNTDFGTANFFYIEDNTFNGGTDDCTFGGRVVVRHNTFTSRGSVQTHPTGGGGANERGCRAYEVYQNTFSGSNSNPEFNAFWLSSGGALIWGNSLPAGYTDFVTLHSMRRNANTYPEQPTPGGWGYCGTSFNGTGSPWDQNSNTTTGYACIDQPGRGKGDLITGMAPNWVNSTTGSISWLHQALDPVYEWNDTWACSGCAGAFMSVGAADEAQVLVNNQDYYFQCGSNNSSCPSFTGAAGTGSGTLASRASACTPMVAYWATDQNRLYQCSTANTWTAYYAPYTYPHPLQSGSTSIAAPSNLTATVN